MTNGVSDIINLSDIKILVEINCNMLYRYASNCSSVTVAERIEGNIIKVLDYNIQDVKLKSSLENSIHILFSKKEQQTKINNENDSVSKDITNDTKSKEVSV